MCASLIAKEDLLRDEAVSAITILSGQCSDVAAIDSLLKAIFNVLGGSEGKLTATAQKISLLKAAGLLSQTTVTGKSLQDLCVTATDMFIKVK